LKKLLVIILCALMLTFAVTGCANDTENDYDPNDYNDYDPTERRGESAENWGDDNGATNGSDTGGCHFFDFEHAFAAFPPDTVMLRVEDLTITWEELFFGMYGTIQAVLANRGGVIDWSEILFDDVTMAQAILDNAVENLLEFKALEFAGTRLGMSYEIVRDSVRDEFEALIEEHETEDAVWEMLWHNAGIRSREVLDFVIGTRFMVPYIFEEMFGEDGASLPDEDIEAFFAEHGEEFLMAKHILFSLMNEETADTAAERAEEILQRLMAFDGDDFEAFFDELMFTYSEDPGSFNFPQGYIFQFHEMVPEFSSAVVELEVGEFSQIVESSFGYHIILRIPLNFNVAPMGSQFSVRSIAAQEMFAHDVFGRISGFNIERTAEFYSIVLEDIFIPC